MKLPPAYGSRAPDFASVEFDTGQLDHDGRVIYGRVYDIGALPTAAASPKSVAHGLTGLHRLWVGERSWASDGTTTLPLPFVSTNADAQVSLSINATNIQVGVGTDRDTFSGEVTLYYTKA